MTGNYLAWQQYVQHVEFHNIHLEKGKTFKNWELNSPVSDDFLKHTLKQIHLNLLHKSFIKLIMSTKSLKHLYTKFFFSFKYSFISIYSISMKLGHNSK